MTPFSTRQTAITVNWRRTVAIRRVIGVIGGPGRLGRRQGDDLTRSRPVGPDRQSGPLQDNRSDQLFRAGSGQRPGQSQGQDQEAYDRQNESDAPEEGMDLIVPKEDMEKVDCD